MDEKRAVQLVAGRGIEGNANQGRAIAVGDAVRWLDT